jgi:signal peptidase I
MLRTLLKWLAEPVATVLFVFFATTAIAQPFYVPSGSMEPTLRIGDAMIASKFAYGYSTASLPLVLGARQSGRWLGSLPARGDIVIFRLPGNPKTVLVKRLIGLPGDRIQMIHGQLAINGRLLPLTPAGTGHVEDNDGNKIAILQFTETLPNGVRHPVYKRHWDGMLDDTPEITVPKGHLFVMGDNRDNSSDSRVPQDLGGVGLLPVANLIGKAEFTLGSYDFRNAHRPADWLGQFRLSRFFRRIV